MGILLFHSHFIGMPQTVNAGLQAKLSELARLADEAQSVSQFVRAFVPHDVIQSEEEVNAVIRELHADPQRLQQYKDEIKVIADGSNVRKIGGNQTDEAIFFFHMPDSNANIERVCSKRKGNCKMESSSLSNNIKDLWVLMCVNHRKFDLFGKGLSGDPPND